MITDIQARMFGYVYRASFRYRHAGLTKIAYRRFDILNLLRFKNE